MKYDELEMEVIRFDAEDVITTSGEGQQQDEEPNALYPDPTQGGVQGGGGLK